jgi:nucleoside-diphosphate-sugar epimerase
VTQFFNLAVIYDRPAYSVAQIDAVNVELPLRVMAALARNGDPVACVMGDSFYRKYPTDTTAQPRYTESKLRLADRLRSRGTSGPCRVAMLLIEQVYGPGENLQKAYPRVVRQMLENVRRVSLTHGIQKRDFIDVDDVIQALLLAARSDFSGFVETGCGSGTSTMVRDVFERLRDLTDSSSELGFGDIPPDQSIPDSTANTEWLRQRGWACRVPLVDGLRKFVHDIAQRSQEKAASS